jgi:hypothetical protein
MQESLNFKVLEKLCKVVSPELTSNWDTPQIQSLNEIYLFN